LTLYKAHLEAMDEKLFNQWLVYGQLEYSFDEFKQIMRPKHRTSKEIMKDVYGYIEEFNRGMTQIQ